jgi:hypothetical protein
MYIYIWGIYIYVFMWGSVRTDQSEGSGGDVFSRMLPYAIGCYVYIYKGLGDVLVLG